MNFTRPSIFLLALLLLYPAMPKAQDRSEKLPDIPLPIQNLVDRGAQIRYLGQVNGLDGWITILRGQEQYFYVTPDGESIMMGVLFDKQGKLITTQQVAGLQRQESGLLDDFASDQQNQSFPSLETVKQELEKKTPAEELFEDIENSNWVAFGAPDAPVIYSFIDPKCPHCKDFMQDIRQDYLEAGKIQIRAIPVGFSQEALAMAAYMLAAPDSQGRFFRHLDGDETALPAKHDISNQGVQKNLALMQAWKFNVTPMSFYRGKDGKVKIVRGKPKDIDGILTDLP